MLKIHKPYKMLLVGTSLFVSGALLLGYSFDVLGFEKQSSAYAASGGAQWLHQNGSATNIESGITDMQQVNSQFVRQFCSNKSELDTTSPAGIVVGDTLDLKDVRDNNVYRIVKLEDGNCWMQQSLRLMNKTVSSADSDMASGSFTVPPSDASGFSAMTDTDGYAPKAYYGNNTDHGAYYNWFTATAGAGTSGVTSGDVSTSICPKGWKLPTNVEYSNLLSKAGIANNSAGSTKIRSAPYNFVYAGYVTRGGLANVYFFGYYWSRTASSSYYAYALSFGSGGVNPTNGGSDRYLGYPVRCVADPEYMPEPEIPPSSKDSNIMVNVTPTITLDVSDGVTTTAEADKVSTGEIKATVTSNTSYDVLLSAEEPKLVGQNNSVNYIPVVSIDNPVQPGSSAWGILNSTGLYDPVTTIPTTFYNTTEAKENAIEHTFGVGISINSALPADTYATEVTVTAGTK